MASQKIRPRPPRLPYMGSGGDFAKYAPAYLNERLWQLENDIATCLASRPADDGPGFAHAYFPALMMCCGLLELLANLHAGTTKDNPSRLIKIYRYSSTYLQNPGYTQDNLRVLYTSLRNPTAHHAIAGGIWCDIDKKYQSRRIAWIITADTRRPGLSINAQSGVLYKDPPYDCPHTHRMKVRIGRLWRDIRESVENPNGYRNALLSNSNLMRNFRKCIAEIFPK